MKSLTLLLAASLCLSCSGALAADASVERLVAMSITRETIVSMQRQVESTEWVVIRQSLDRANLGPAADAAVADLKARIAAAVAGQFSEANIRGIFVRAYVETFSREEIDAIIAFLETPAGRAYIAKKPALIGNVGAALQQEMGPFALRLQQDVAESLQKAQRADGKKPAAP
jgi:hypothetical protein